MKLRLKLIICGLALGALSLAVHSCSKDYMEQYETSLELNSNISRSMVADSSVTFIGDIEKLTIGENTTPINIQYIDIDTYFYDANHAYTLRIKVRYQYTEDLMGSSIVDYDVYIVGQSPMPLFTLDYCNITQTGGSRRFKVRAQGKLDLSPLSEDGVGNIVPIGGEREVTL